MRKFHRILALVGWVVVGLFLAGCGGPNRVTQKGTITYEGKPLKIGPQGVVQVILIPVVKPGEQFTTFIADYDTATGSFTAANVPPGKYRFSVEQLDPFPANIDKLKGAFKGNQSPLEYEVTGQKSIDIDLAKVPGK